MRNSKPTSAPTDDPDAARAQALRLLARREHSVLELRRKLEQRGWRGELLDAVLDSLVEQNLLSDRRFAEVYTRGRIERGYGPLRIRAELRERGIDGGLAEAALAAEAPDWIERARDARLRRFGEALPADYRERARQMRFLQQRGFDSGQIRAAFEENGV